MSSLIAGVPFSALVRHIGSSFTDETTTPIGHDTRPKLTVCCGMSNRCLFFVQAPSGAFKSRQQQQLCQIRTVKFFDGSRRNTTPPVYHIIPRYGYLSRVKIIFFLFIIFQKSIASKSRHLQLACPAQVLCPKKNIFSNFRFGTKVAGGKK